MTAGRPFSEKYLFATVVVLFATTLLICLFHERIWEYTTRAYVLFTDRDRTQIFINSFGHAAPLVFILIQILQVLLAPIPGEATGFIGGYLFGTLAGFTYSSIGLAVGSVLNFSVGRFFGIRYVRKWIPAETFDKMDRVIKRQGTIILFLLFIFPGFPKDYLCLFLGVSTLPLKVFLLMAALGRMPGTLMLSLQGASLFEKNYGMLLSLVGLCIVLGVLAYRFRVPLYRWIEKKNGASP